jgi:hypothetical protein
MAKPPGWLVLKEEGVAVEDGLPVYRVSVRVRYWHPGLWWALLKALREQKG